MSDHITSSMIPGAEIRIKSLTEGFYEHHCIFFSICKFIIDLIIDQQKTGNRIFIFAGSIRLKQPHEWLRIPSSAINCTLSSRSSTQKSSTLVPVHQVCLFLHISEYFWLFLIIFDYYHIPWYIALGRLDRGHELGDDLWAWKWTTWGIICDSSRVYPRQAACCSCRRHWDHPPHHARGEGKRARRRQVRSRNRQGRRNPLVVCQ